jgi:hypothetical protein
MPPLNSPAASETQASRSHRLRYYNNVISAFFNPLVEEHKGSFVLKLQGKYHYFVPEICLIIQDSLEVRLI